MEIKQTFIRLGRNGQSIYYEPFESSIRKGTAILIMHSDADYLTIPMGPAMASRGYPVLCANVENRAFGLDRKILDLKRAVEELKSRPGIGKIVLMGHSGGGTLMTAYQNLAENGLETFQGPEKLLKCSDELKGLPPADGMMLLDSNFGIAAMSLFSLDPAVVNEENGVTLDEELNLFNGANGFDPEGSSYSQEFIGKFQKAQGRRNQYLIQRALERLEALEKGRGRYEDDEPFIIPGAEQGFMNNKLYAQDIRLMARTRNPWPLLKADGSEPVQIIRSVRKPENRKSLTGSYSRGALITTVRTYLNSYAVRTGEDYGYDESNVYGIDWTSGYNCPPGNIRGVTIPLLVMGMTGNWEYLASETIYENSPSPDKTLVFVEGASHKFDTAVHCESYPGEFGDTEARTFDYADRWLSAPGRFR